MFRRKRLRLIRARLAELLESKELHERAAHADALPLGETDGAGLELRVRSLLEEADSLEGGHSPYLDLVEWRQQAEALARQLEEVAEWAGIS